MKLVVGLGNPGNRYVGTRHNVGFEVLAKLAHQYEMGASRQRFQAEVGEIRVGTEKVILLSPLTYMNRSGSSVQPACDFYQLDGEDVLVVTDDLNLEVAQLRLRKKGSAGGQKGLADIIRRLGTDEVPRLRIGIGPVPPRWDAADFVLGKFTPEQRELIDQAVSKAAKAVVDWVQHDLQYCMNLYNTRPAKPKQDKPKQDKPKQDKQGTSKQIKDDEPGGSQDATGETKPSDQRPSDAVDP